MSQKGAARKQLKRGAGESLPRAVRRAGSDQPKAGITAWMRTADLRRQMRYKRCALFLYDPGLLHLY